VGARGGKNNWQSLDAALTKTVPLTFSTVWRASLAGWIALLVVLTMPQGRGELIRFIVVACSKLIVEAHLVMM
jgi:hypothetical protein